MFKEYYGKLLAQLAVDLNCKPEDLRKTENIVTVSALNEGRRRYIPDKFFLQMATVGCNTVISADECMQEFLKNYVKDREGLRLFEHGCLSDLDEELKKYGLKMGATQHKFLPYRDVEVERDITVKWFYDDEIKPFYGDIRFPDAICFPEPNPGTPDKIVVAAYDGDRIMGMSGCSEDCPGWMQIGVDVLPEYRMRGLGIYLVTLMKNKILEMGGIPFYGTTCANISSQRIALACGFRPAWVETTAEPCESKYQDQDEF
ncbi:MAG: GNAT family N-acetyltransferase [Ruminococcus sp.]|nr:GNAT family N-acetyltransferase [Ruminococcus sp.]